MKKVLSLVLAIVMVLSSMSFAFAGTFEDVTDKVTAKAVDALSALGVVKGNPDGTYKPENSVTRAEMAAMLVRALGHSDLAAGSSSSFKDTQGKWYDGEVAIAQSIGLTNGYPDGTFKGENKVSYTEAITMIMRALGYNNQAVNSNRSEGYNETSYKTAASRLGILKNISVKSGDANRGDIAIMLYNSLECTVVIVDKDGNPVAQTVVLGANTVAKTLLDQIAKADFVNVKPNTVIEGKREYEESLVDLDPYMYQNIKVYRDAKGTIVFVKGSTTDTVTGTLKANDTVNKVTIDSTAYTLDIPSATPVYYNGKEVTVAEIDLENAGTSVAIPNMLQLKGAKITAILDDNEEITGIVATLPTKAYQIDTEYVSGKTTLNGATIKLPVKDSKVNLDALTVKGAVTSLEDIEEGDVVSLYVPAGDKSNTTPSKLTLVVTRNTVTGKITKSNANGQYYINTEDAYFYPSEIAGSETFTVQDVEGVFYFDEFGDIFAFAPTSVAKTNYAIVLDTVNGGAVGGRTFTPEIELMNTDGDVVTYAVKSDATYKANSTATAVALLVNEPTGPAGNLFNINTLVQKDNLVKFTVNSKNQITSITMVDNDLTTSDSTNTAGKTFVLADNAVIINKEGSADYSIVSEALTGYVDVLAKETNVYGEIILLVVDGLGNTDSYAYITKIETAINSAGATVQLVSGYIDGEFFSKYTDAANTVTSSAIYGQNIYLLDLEGDVITADTLASTIVAGNDYYNAHLNKNVTANVTSRHNVVNVTGGSYTITADTVVYAQKYLADGTTVVFSTVTDKTDIYENSSIDVYCVDGTTTAAIIVIRP